MVQESPPMRGRAWRLVVPSGLLFVVIAGVAWIGATHHQTAPRASNGAANTHLTTASTGAVQPVAVCPAVPSAYQGGAYLYPETHKPSLGTDISICGIGFQRNENVVLTLQKTTLHVVADQAGSFVQPVPIGAADCNMKTVLVAQGDQGSHAQIAIGQASGCPPVSP